MDVRRAEPRARAQVVREARCLGRDDERVLRRVLDVHHRYRVERARDDRVCTVHVPQLVRALPEQPREALEHGIRLDLPAHEATGEAHDGVEVAVSEVVDIHEACGVERDVEPMFVRGVAVGRLGVYTGSVEDFGGEGG